MTWVARNSGLIISEKWWEVATIDDSEIVAVWQAIGANSEVDSYVNLVNPGTYDLAIQAGTPTWTRGAGWGFDGSSYFDTGITQDPDHTVMIMFTDAIMNRRLLFGSTDAVPLRAFRIRETSTVSGVTMAYFIAAGGNTQAATVNVGGRVVVGMNRTRLFHSQASPQIKSHGGATWGATALTHYLGYSNGTGSNEDPWASSIQAVAIYNRVLTALEMTQIAEAMLLLTAEVSPALNVNYIAQHPATRQRGSIAHELLIAMDNGVYRSFNGGREWARLTLPDPSNTEFSDSSPATIDDLAFDWAAYSPTGLTTLYLRGISPGTSRMWVYKSADNGLSWTSRGVVDSGSAAKDFDVAPMISSPCDIDADESYLYLAALDATGFPVLIQLNTNLGSDGTIVFDPGAGTNIGVETGRFDANTIWIAGDFGGTDTVEKSEDAGGSFAVKDPGTFGAIGAFKVGPDSDLRVMVFDTTNSDLYETIDDGDNWTALNTSVAPTIRAIGRLGQNTQECVFGNASAASDNIDYSINSGEDLEDYSGGFPQVDVNGVVVN